MHLDPEQLKALDKLEKLAAERLAEFVKANRSDVGWMSEYALLSAVPGHVRNIKQSHTNPMAWSSVQGSLETLRSIAKQFKFNLKDET